MQILDDIARLGRMDTMEPMRTMDGSSVGTIVDTDKASFLDIFRGLVDNVVETNEQVDRDMLDVMLGNVDDLATLQSNVEKAGVAVDLLVAVKNEAVSAYSTIINMQI